MIYVIFSVGFGLAYLFGYRAGRRHAFDAIISIMGPDTVLHAIDAFLAKKGR